MIQKVMLSSIETKMPIRSSLKSCTSRLKNLAGSSLSGMHGPNMQPTDMIIPGGLDMKEKAYYLLKGKMPKSVYERWFPQSDNYIAHDGDQVVSVYTSGHYVGNVISDPHDVGVLAHDGDSFTSGADNSSILGGADDSHSIFSDIWDAITGG